MAVGEKIDPSGKLTDLGAEAVPGSSFDANWLSNHSTLANSKQMPLNTYSVPSHVPSPASVHCFLEFSQSFCN
jgi:hypothetical protein